MSGSVRSQQVAAAVVAASTECTLLYGNLGGGMMTNIGPLGAVVAVLALGISGCASGGNAVLANQDTTTVNQVIVDGTTTRDQVLAMYGGPNQTTFTANGHEQWTYVWAHRAPQAQSYIPIVGVFAAAVDLQEKRLIILFNEQNVVAKHSMTEAAATIKRDFGSTPSVSQPLGAAASSPPPQPQTSKGTGSRNSVAAATAAGPQDQAVSRPVTPPPSPVPLPPAALPAAGLWDCKLGKSAANPQYTLTFSITPDARITVLSYGSVQATGLGGNPLTFSAMNPNGNRLTTFVWNADNSMSVSGPSSSNPGKTFRDVGTCAKT